MLELFSQLSTKDLFLNTAILAVVFKSIWMLLTELVQHIRHLFSKRITTYQIELGPYHPEFDGVINFYCLIIRFGTDSYLQGLASESDKFDGRLQNKVIPINIRKTANGTAQCVLNLPVHLRIGTQFKCFAEVNSSADLNTALASLEACERIYDVSKSSSQFRHRVYFLLKDFSVCQSVDKINNNMCFPV